MSIFNFWRRSKPSNDSIPRTSEMEFLRNKLKSAESEIENLEERLDASEKAKATALQSLSYWNSHRTSSVQNFNLPTVSASEIKIIIDATVVCPNCNDINSIRYFFEPLIETVCRNCVKPFNVIYPKINRENNA